MVVDGVMYIYQLSDLCVVGVTRGAVNLGRKDPASIVLRLEADKSQRNPANDQPLKVENQSLLRCADPPQVP